MFDAQSVQIATPSHFVISHICACSYHFVILLIIRHYLTWVPVAISIFLATCASQMSCMVMKCLYTYKKTESDNFSGHLAMYIIPELLVELIIGRLRFSNRCPAWYILAAA